MMKNKSINYSDSESDSDSDSEEEKTVKDSGEDKYAVTCLDNNKEGIEQPNCCTIELLPKLPTGILVIGRSGSGKTNAVVTLLTKECLLKDAFDFTYIYTGGVKPDEKMIKQLGIPKENIKDDFKIEEIEELMTKLQKTVDKQGMDKTPSVLLIFDDILGRSDFLKSKTFTKLVTTNRHSRITYIVLSQYFKKLPPVARTNASYYMIFPSSSAEIDKIADELAPPSMDKKEFIQIAKYATKEKYSFLSINTKADGDKQLRKNFNNVLNL
tara:strand:+ start:261 stop:1067 length:807 start_codon:yes stop_codon:yes gene_type:complete